MVKKINKNRLKNKYKLILVFLIFICLFVLSTGYFKNTNKFFKESITPRTVLSYNGYGLVRSSNDFIVDGCGTAQV